MAMARGRLAQLVEQLAYNQQVIGSSPVAPTGSNSWVKVSLEGRQSNPMQMGSKALLCQGTKPTAMTR